MGAFVKGIGAMFGGGASSQPTIDQSGLAAVAQARTQEATQAASDTSNQALAALAGAPRGQRLLMSSQDGGLATTLGGSA